MAIAILVVGATGQVGSLVVRRLRQQGEPVRAMVRDPASTADLVATGAELVVADLGRPETLDAPLDGFTAVVATANAVAPVRPGDSAAVVDAGYAELVRRAERAGVSRFVLAGVPVTELDEAVPVVRTKRRTEELLAESRLSWLSLRMPPFSEVSLALVDSELPLRGEERTTPARATRPCGGSAGSPAARSSGGGSWSCRARRPHRRHSCRCTTRRLDSPRRSPSASGWLTPVAPCLGASWASTG